MAKIDGIKKVQAMLQRKQKQADEASVSVIVGYTASYALYVHEDLQSRHPVGQAKFLEQPARQFKGELVAMVVEAVRKGASMLQGLMLAGLRLQREAQLLTPVDTGNLRGSAFTRKD